MDLNNVSHLFPNQLSGGQKRKLCLGIAFINKPSVLILDEPTTGVDPASRQSIYEFIDKIKKGNRLF